MISWTAKKLKYIPIHQIAVNVPGEVINTIISFHTLTGCDTTCSFNKYGKKNCRKIFLKETQEWVGRDSQLQPIEQFICNLYGNPELHIFE